MNDRPITLTDEQRETLRQALIRALACEQLFRLPKMGSWHPEEDRTDEFQALADYLGLDLR